MNELLFRCKRNILKSYINQYKLGINHKNKTQELETFFKQFSRDKAYNNRVIL
jgi:hypothetical protein